MSYVLATQAVYGLANKGHNDNYTAAGCVSRADTGWRGGNTYLALGDSYTVGQSVTEAARYPLQAVARLNTQGDPVQAPEIIAETGWTTGDLLGALAAGQPAI